MKKYLERVSEALRDEEFEGIEYLLTHIIIALWTLIVLCAVGLIFGG